MTSTDKSLQTIKIYGRPRPLSKAEADSKCSNIVQSITSREIWIKSGFNERKYCFDHIFAEDATQSTVFNVVVAPLINSIISGYNCTVLAYGQTGTGKKHTIFGENKMALETNFKTDSSIGLVLRTSEHLFAELSKLSLKTEYTVRVSFIEVYNEEVRDLLSDSLPLRVYDDPLNKGSVCMKELAKVTVFNTRDVNDWLNIGLKERLNTVTTLNTQISRSHALFTFLVNVREVTSRAEEVIKTGRLHLIVLAGSENAGRAGARETGTINRSVISVGKVIKALSHRMQHIPYRDSKLTRILQDSFGGNAKTCMIAMFSPSANAWDETVATLDLAQITRTVSNCPQVNINRKQANFLKDMEDEILKLREDLSAARAGQGFYLSAESYEHMTQEVQTNNQKILTLIKQIRELEEHTRSQELQYKKLYDSFEKTKVYSEIVTKELKEKEQIVKQEEDVLNLMRDRHEELRNSAKLLLDVCEKSGKLEDICHSKFQDKILLNQNNAKIFKGIVTTAVQCLGEVKNASQAFVENKNQNLIDVQEGCESLKSEYTENLGKLNEIITEIQGAEKKHMLEPDKVLKMGYVDDYNQEVGKFPKEVFHATRKPVDMLADVKDGMHSSKENLVTEMGKLDLSEKVCCQALDEELMRRDTFIQETEANLLNLQNKVIEKEAHLEDQVMRDTEKLTHLKNKIVEIDREEKELLEEAAAVERSKKVILRLIESNRNMHPSEQIKKRLFTFMEEATDVIEEQKTATTNVECDVHVNKKNLCSSIDSDVNQIDQFVGGLVGTIQGNLSQHNTAVKTVSVECDKKLDGIKENVLRVMQTSDEVAKNMYQISEYQNNYNSDVQNIVQQSLESLEELEKSISFAGHAGDTPVKETYVYPKQTGSIPNPPLLEESDDDSEEKPTPESKAEESSQ